MTKSNSIIDPFAQERTAHYDKVIERVQRLAHYSQAGSDIGIPWDLFEAYIEALDKKQAAFCSAGEWSAKKCLAAPVSLNTEAVHHKIGSDLVYVYPVIS